MSVTRVVDKNPFFFLNDNQLCYNNDRGNISIKSKVQLILIKIKKKKILI